MEAQGGERGGRGSCLVRVKRGKSENNRQNTNTRGRKDFRPPYYIRWGVFSEVNVRILTDV